MAEAVFYVLPSESPQERYLFACKLIEKAYRSGRFCYVLTDTEEQGRKMDDLLWTFRAGSFIPHELYTGELPGLETVVLIGASDAPEGRQKTVINLSSRCPGELGKIERVLEILDNNEATKKLGRDRYRHYQQSGVSITTHRMGH